MTDVGVAIVGGGMAGLACARHLLEQSETIRVVILEAADVMGGRVIAGEDGLDLGAEFVHGHGTLLTQWIEHYLPDCRLDPLFTLSHADGGGCPDPEPTEDGMYGMYFVDGSLRPADDPFVKQLSDALVTVLESDDEPRESLGEALEGYDLPQSLIALARASYGNTAGCSDLYQLSLPTLQKFEHYWEEHEVEGDSRPSTGLSALVTACLSDLHARFPERFHVQTTWEVAELCVDEDNHVEVRSTQGSSMTAGRVVVTVPSPLWSTIDFTPPLPTEKIEAASYIGFERAIKSIFVLKDRCWPEKLQNVIGGDLIMPEMWFRTLGSNFVSVGYMVSEAANLFHQSLKGYDEEHRRIEARRIHIAQLATVFEVDESSLEENAVSYHYFDWVEHRPSIGGGYMYPRVGMRISHLETLAEAHGPIHFVGEATHTKACCTVQAALESGVRAANEILLE